MTGEVAVDRGGWWRQGRLVATGKVGGDRGGCR